MGRLSVSSPDEMASLVLTRWNKHRADRRFQNPVKSRQTAKEEWAAALTVLHTLMVDAFKEVIASSKGQ